MVMVDQFKKQDAKITLVYHPDKNINSPNMVMFSDILLVELLKNNGDFHQVV